MIVADVWHSHHWIDFRDWLGAIATAAAAIFAAWTIRQSGKQAKAAAIASLTERRVDHALSVLRALTEALPKPGRPGVAGLLAMLDERLPITRGVFRIDATTEEIEAGSRMVRERLTAEDPSIDLDALAKGGFADVIAEPKRLVLAMEEIASTAKSLVQQRPSITEVSRGLSERYEVP